MCRENLALSVRFVYTRVVFLFLSFEPIRMFKSRYMEYFIVWFAVRVAVDIVDQGRVSE